MSYSARITTRYEISASTDYSRSIMSPVTFTDTFTPDEYDVKLLEVGTGGDTLTTSTYTTVSKVILYNSDTTNFVTAVYRTGGGSTTDQTMAIPAGEVVILTDITAANSVALTADTAACLVHCVVI